MIRICTFYTYTRAAERRAMLAVHDALQRPLNDDRDFCEDLVTELENVGFGDAKLRREDNRWHVTLDGRPMMTWSRTDELGREAIAKPRTRPAHEGQLTLDEAARHYGYNRDTLRYYATMGLLATTGTGRNRTVTADAMKALRSKTARSRFDPQRTDGLKASLRRRRDRQVEQRPVVQQPRRTQRSSFAIARKRPAIAALITDHMMWLPRHLMSPRRRPGGVLLDRSHSPAFHLLGRARGPTVGGDRAPP